MSFITAFENNYIRLVTALPMDRLLPTLEAHGLMRNIGLSQRIKATSGDSYKARLFLDELIKPGLQVGATDTFEKFIKAVEEYAE